MEKEASDMPERVAWLMENVPTWKDWSLQHTWSLLGCTTTTGIVALTQHQTVSESYTAMPDMTQKERKSYQEMSPHESG